MVYLIGTNHELQHDARPKRAATERVRAAREEFASFLRATAAKVGAIAIAEEFAEEINLLLRAQSLCQTVAKELEILHRYCEPNSATRLELGVPNVGTEDLPPLEKERTRAIRQQYWLQELRHLHQGPILFVCGAEHVHSFAERLRSANIPVTIVSEYWGRELYAA